MVRRVDAAAGITVDVPRTAELRILLDNRVADAEMPECHGERNGAHAGADDQNMMLRQGLVRWRSAPARLARDKSHLLAHQRRVFARDIFAEAGPHHPEHQFVAGIGDDRLWLAMSEQLDDGGTDFILNIRG